MDCRARIVAASCLIAASAALAAPALAQAQPFYQGKQLSLVINLSAGGPTDTEARLLARHLGPHIPGNPTIVPRIMTGAGGVVAANWLGQVAPPDGLSLGFFSSVAGAAAMDVPSVKIDVSKLAFVAAGSGVSVTYGRKNIGTGLSRPEDLVNQQNFWVGGLAIDNDKDLRLRLQLDLLGLPYKYVTGYPGASDIRLAIQRNEAQITSESMPSYRAAVEPSFVASGEVIPLWYDYASEGERPAPHEADGIAALSFYEYFRKLKGRPPSGLKWDAFDVMNTVARGYERIIVMAPGTPKEAIAELQKGFAALASDSEFRDDAMTTMKFVPNYDTSAEAERIFVIKMRPNPLIVDFFKSYIEEGKHLSASK